MTQSMVSTAPAGPPARGSEFAELSRIVLRAGLMQRRRAYYLVKIALTIAAFAAAWAVFGYLGDSWWQLLLAVFLAAASTQLAFLGHDAGHKQIFRGRRANDVVGLLHAGLVGVSYGWWTGKHTRHHANPNHEDEDPDLGIPVLAFTRNQGRATRGVLRWMAKYQAFMFFPLLLLEGMSLHVESVRHVWRRSGIKFRHLEKGLLALHLVVYFGVVFLVLSPWQAIAFIAIHQGLWGLYMGCAFAPNHKGMPTVTDGHTLDFLRKQVVTSRNISGSRWVDFTLGGLNYQIEHHLFPSMPRPNLRRVQPIVRDFCAARGIGYYECGAFRSYGQVLRHLHAVGAPLRAQA